MSEETERLLRELTRMIVEERQLLLNHIKLNEPRSNDSELFLFGLRSALDTLSKRIQLVTDLIDKMGQQSAHSSAQLRTIEDLVRPLHAFAYGLALKCPNCKRDESTSGG